MWVFNLLSVETAAAEMTGTASRNPRVKDAVHHVIISWPENEKPTYTQAKEAGEIALKELGFDVSAGGHQAFIGLHPDTKCWHIDVCANKVHPQTLKSHHVEFSHNALHKACRKIEIDQGWSNQSGLMEVLTDVNGKEHIVKSDYRNDRNKGINQKALDTEKYSGVVSFERYIKETVGPKFKDFLESKNKSWEDAHVFLNDFNVKIIERSGGISFQDLPLYKNDFTDAQREVEKDRASKIFAGGKSAGDFSKKSRLEKKLGNYVEMTTKRKLPHFFYDENKEKGVAQIKRENDNPVQKKSPCELKLRAIFNDEVKQSKIAFSEKKASKKIQITDVKKAEELDLKTELKILSVRFR